VRAGYKYPFISYMVLGDDVIIADEKVAISYKDIMSQIGVNITRIKSVVSKPGYFSSEFASKWLINGIDVSPLPCGLLLEGSLLSITRMLSSYIVIVHETLEASDVSSPQTVTSEDLSQQFTEKIYQLNLLKGLIPDGTSTIDRLVDI